MQETLVYDSARDAASGLSIMNLGTAAIVIGLLLMAIPTIQLMRRDPAKRTRGLLGLGLLALIGVGVVTMLQQLDTRVAARSTQEIKGIVSSVTPKLLTVGGIKIMYSCAATATCPGVQTGDLARVAVVDDSGPETSALAVRIWRQSR